MTFQAVLNRISEFVSRFVGTSQNSDVNIITDISRFIVDHKLILFFVLCSFLFTGISIIRRLIRS